MYPYNSCVSLEINEKRVKFCYLQQYYEQSCVDVNLEHCNGKPIKSKDM